MNEGTLKVTPITDKQPQPACRFSIQATLRGFPITIEGEGRAGDLKIIVDRLLAAGAERARGFDWRGDGEMAGCRTTRINNLQKASRTENFQVSHSKPLQ